MDTHETRSVAKTLFALEKKWIYPVMHLRTFKGILLHSSVVRLCHPWTKIPGLADKIRLMKIHFDANKRVGIEHRKGFVLPTIF